MESGTRAPNLFECRAEAAACGNPGFLLQIGREWLLVLLLLLGGRRKDRLLSDATDARSLMEDTSIHSDAILAEGTFLPIRIGSHVEVFHPIREVSKAL